MKISSSVGRIVTVRKSTSIHERVQALQPRRTACQWQSESKEFAEIYLRDHAELHKRSARRDREILKTLNRFFGLAILHEITSHRIEQFKRDRLNGNWRAFRQKKSANPVKPATVNRELDTLKSILSKAVEWKYLVDSPARGVKRFRVQNRRTRILSTDEQQWLLDACERMPKLQALLTLALITGARIGELLALRWQDCEDGYLTFCVILRCHAWSSTVSTITW